MHKYKCERCGYSTNRKYSIDKHLNRRKKCNPNKLHGNIKLNENLDCKHCGKTYARKDILNHHIKTIHADIINNTELSNNIDGTNNSITNNTTNNIDNSTNIDNSITNNIDKLITTVNLTIKNYDQMGVSDLTLFEQSLMNALNFTTKTLPTCLSNFVRYR